MPGGTQHWCTENDVLEITGPGSETAHATAEKLFGVFVSGPGACTSSIGFVSAEATFILNGACIIASGAATPAHAL
jgi:hypothetical protein